MALWGTKDLVYSTGNVNVNVTTGVVTKQSGAIAWTAGNGVKVGQVITVDGTAEGVIKSIDTATGNSCLLYTSPSPRDNRVSRMPSSA